ncbi:MAG: rRNA adenine N-6-methyltransferase family protein [Acidimicrobiales bacterium]
MTDPQDALPDYLTRTAVRDLLDRHELAASRALGQNFLCDPSMIEKIVRLSGVGRGDRVIEVGPGLGALTVGLVRAGAVVTRSNSTNTWFPPCVRSLARLASTFVWPTQ